ncbi:hypothetical protein PRIPAC_95995 [Pristionchus pacificus]|uniref:Matrix-remodeling-associated protein 7 helical domain-containing protein n=1 Tax=Pristionchus pacificus TaxID=54126 RepID=A0A2A6BCG5_PRIPA|nr:hypothetical protein PRIPAC_95995 [Pristionchus pacificus]|eukprot:PDM63554.1 hypothetical protein PRIPAC_49527 [Pristionchus pacificus]
MSCSASRPPPSPPQMPQQSQTVPEYWKVDGVLEKVFKLLGMESFFQSWRGGELDKWLENRFPTHLKEHVNVIFIGTAVTGAILGFLIFYSFFSCQSRKRNVHQRKPSDESGLDKASLSMEEEQEGESDDENTPLRILHGRFNKDVIRNLHKFNKENGELIRLGDPQAADEEDSAMYDEEDDDDMPQLEIAEIEDGEQTKGLGGRKETTPTEDAMIEKLGTLHGKLATAKIRQESIKMKKKMSADEREEESRIRAQQLEAIMALMKADKDKFGENSEELLLDQMESLYNI